MKTDPKDTLYQCTITSPLSEYPKQRVSLKNAGQTISLINGDTHANALNLLTKWIHFDLIDITEAEYQILVNAYTMIKDCTGAWGHQLTKEDIQNLNMMYTHFTTILASKKLHMPEGVETIIDLDGGDGRADRGDDWSMFLVLRWFREQQKILNTEGKIRLERNESFSNHVVESLWNYVNDRFKKNNSLIFLFATDSSQTVSQYSLLKLIKAGIITEEDVETEIAASLKDIQLFPYIILNNQIYPVPHAPVLPGTIIDSAQYLGVEIPEKFDTFEITKKFFDDINRKFQEKIATNKAGLKQLLTDMKCIYKLQLVQKKPDDLTIQKNPTTLYIYINPQNSQQLEYAVRDVITCKPVRVAIDPISKENFQWIDEKIKHIDRGDDDQRKLLEIISSVMKENGHALLSTKNFLHFTQNFLHPLWKATWGREETIAAEAKHASEKQWAHHMSMRKFVDMMIHGHTSAVHTRFHMKMLSLDNDRGKHTDLKLQQQDALLMIGVQNDSLKLCQQQKNGVTKYDHSKARNDPWVSGTSFNQIESDFPNFLSTWKGYKLDKKFEDLIEEGAKYVALLHGCNVGEFYELSGRFKAIQEGLERFITCEYSFYVGVYTCLTYLFYKDVNWDAEEDKKTILKKCVSHENIKPILDKIFSAKQLCRLDTKSLLQKKVLAYGAAIIANGMIFKDVLENTLSKRYPEILLRSILPPCDIELSFNNIKTAGEFCKDLYLDCGVGEDARVKLQDIDSVRRLYAFIAHYDLIVQIEKAIQVQENTKRDFLSFVRDNLGVATPEAKILLLKKDKECIICSGAELSEKKMLQRIESSFQYTPPLKPLTLEKNQIHQSNSDIKNTK